MSAVAAARVAAATIARVEQAALLGKTNRGGTRAHAEHSIQLREPVPHGLRRDAELLGDVAGGPSLGQQSKQVLLLPAARSTSGWSLTLGQPLDQDFEA